MGYLNLRDMAIELLRIDQQMEMQLYKTKTKISDYALHTFEQVWGNTSGGFEGMGGSAMTAQNTHVFIPIQNCKSKICLVFFGGSFAYAVPINSMFLEDVKQKNILGKSRYRDYWDVNEQNEEYP